MNLLNIQAPQVAAGGTSLLTLSQLIAQSVLPPNANQFVFTADAGLCGWNGSTWVALQPSALFNALTLSGLLFESDTDNITAYATGGQANATALTTELNRVTTATATTAPYSSVRLPASAGGLTIIVTNHASNPIQVFGAGTDQIDDVATATGVTQMANSMVIYSCNTVGYWYSEGLALGFVRGYALQTSSALQVAANTGNTQALGTPISTMITEFTLTAAASGLLPPSAVGMNLMVHNISATYTLTVFPNTGEAINGGSANAGLSLPPNTSTTFTVTVVGMWHTVPRTPS